MKALEVMGVLCLAQLSDCMLLSVIRSVHWEGWISLYVISTSEIHGCRSVEECLPSMPKSMGSIPSTEK